MLSLNDSSCLRNPILTGLTESSSTVGAIGGVLGIELQAVNTELINMISATRNNDVVISMSIPDRLPEIARLQL